MKLPKTQISSEVIAYKAKYQWPYDALRYADMPDSARRYVVSENAKLFSDHDRAQRVKESLRKITLAKKFLWVWKFLPWVEMVAITGSVASLNASPDHDIDLWIIVSPRRIWLTRFYDWLVFSLLGKRRNRHASNVTDKFCINFYKTSDNFALHQSLAFAVQAVDSIILFQRHDTFWELVKANRWIAKYFPAWHKEMSDYAALLEKSIENKKPSLPFLDAIEYLLGVIQYIKRTGKFTLPGKKEIFVNEFFTWNSIRNE
ncbi:MAG: hypothetical protein QY314_00985 [Candidatus Dojkabacteria bacterium]|nr:MAG: hypothetical protein QY314_00985 [Candidatus Dojkabacteria bacterium]